MPDSEEQQGDGLHSELRRWRRIDGPENLRMRVQRSIRVAETVLYAEGSSTSERLKAATVIQQCARTALKLFEAHELEERVNRLEDLLNKQRNRTNGHTQATN